MRLYAVLNGYQGEGLVHVLVLAEDERHARELAHRAFEATRQPHHQARWSDAAGFRVDELCADAGVAWVSAPRD